jgi:RimJ/RimL family protein N-acetyltransferase
MSVPSIETARLLLRPFTEEDVDPLYHILGQGDVLRYFPNPEPPSQERVHTFVQRQLAHWEEHGYGWWAVQPHQQQELVGWCGLQFLPETEETEVGYLLGRASWGQGWATEAARASLRYGFEELGVTSIVGIVHPENMPSRRVLEKLGMSLVNRAQYFGMDVCRYMIERGVYHATI